MSIPAERGGDPTSVSPEGQIPAERSNVEFEVEFEQLFRERFRSLVGAALSVPGIITLQEAEDAAETAFQEAYQTWPTLTNPGAWVYKATISNVMKIKRKKAREAEALRKVRPEGQVEAQEDPGLMQLEYRQWVMSILDSLPPGQRAAVALCLIDELSPAEASELLGKSGPALRQALHAGREALRRQLDGKPATDPAPVTAAISTTPVPTPGYKEVQ